MQALQILSQQNLVDDSYEDSHFKSVPVISKIEAENIKFKTLISNLKNNKKRSGQSYEFNNESQISNIEHRSDKNSFDLEIPLDIRKPFSLGVNSIGNQKNKQGDLGLKYKPRSTINGRDEYRIRNMNQVHKNIIDSLNQKRKQAEGIQTNNHINDILYKVEPYKVEPYKVSENRSRVNMLTPETHKKKYQDKILSKSIVRKFSQTQKLRGPEKSEKKLSHGSIFLQDINNMNESKCNKRVRNSLNPEDLANSIEPKSLLQYLSRSNSYPSKQSIPNEIYNFFIGLCTYFGIKEHFSEPLIKRYQNCIYFGQKVPKQSRKTYSGFVWYYRKAIYYGQFELGKKNGYGIEIDMEETGNQCFWRGSFLLGKKTGYFSMSNSVMEYNGALKNSYFDGQGQLKTNKSTFKGTFQAGMKQGTGIQVFHHKCLTYRGDYLDNKFQGKGQLEGPNYYYKGQFQNGQQHGKGFQRTQEFQYVGEFKNGKKNGEGVLKMKNGQVIQGIFQDGKIIKEKSSQNQRMSSQNTLQSHYTMNIPIHSPYKNLPILSSIGYNKSPETNKPSPRYMGRRNQNIVLQKHLSKELHSLYQQNQQGTIEQERTNNIKNEDKLIFNLNRCQSDEDEPLETKILPLN